MTGRAGARFVLKHDVRDVGVPPCVQREDLQVGVLRLRGSPAYTFRATQ
jgi:hypothetical protein